MSTHSFRDFRLSEQQDRIILQFRAERNIAGLKERPCRCKQQAETQNGAARVLWSWHPDTMCPDVDMELQGLVFPT